MNERTDRDWKNESIHGLCDCCGQKKKVIDVHFQGSDGRWKRHWCEDCFVDEKHQNLELYHLIDKVLESEKKTSFIKKIVNWFS